MSALPTAAQVRALPAFFDQTVPEAFIDTNGHMNITDYFRLGSWAPWQRLMDLGVDERYIPDRGLSFFTVEHHIRYLSELRLGERFSIGVGFAGRTGKALQAAAFVLDQERDQLSCVLEVMYVHVSMDSRRAVDIPGDVAQVLDTEIDAHPWVADVATGLGLRR